MTTVNSLHDRFRTLDRAQAPDLWPEMVARASSGAVQGLPSERSGPPALRMVLLLAALLAVATLATIAVGALLRTDRNTTGPFSFLGPINVCGEVALPEGVSLAMRSHPGNDGGPPPSELTIYEDGQVIRGPSAEWGGSFNTIEATWMERRLDPEALAPLIESLMDSATECRALADERYITVIARSGADVRSVSLGPDAPFEVRIASDQETATVAAVVDQLADRDLGIAASGWTDAEWIAHDPDRWRVSVSTSPLGERDYPPAAEVVMPGGSTLRNFGAEGIQTDATGARCVVVSAAEATEIALVLTAATEAAGGDIGWSWSFADDEGYVHLAMAGLLPHEPDCGTDPPFDEASPSPPAEPPTPTTGAGVLGDACGYLDPRAVGAALGEMGDVEHHVAWRDDWHMCWYPVAGSGVVVTSSRSGVPAEFAAAQARQLFGELGPIEEIAGRQVFFNRCTDASCRSALIVAADPHYVLVTWVGGDENTLRGFARTIVEAIDSPD